MVNKLKPFLLFILIFSSSVIFFIKPTNAADQTITCNDSGCSGIVGALFEENNLAPLGSLTRAVTANNGYSNERKFAIEIIDSSFSDSSPSLSEVLKVKITEQESGNIVYGSKTIKAFKDDGYQVLSAVPAGQVRHYDFLVEFDDVGNDYQGLTLSFDLRLGFEGTSSEGTSSTEGSVLGDSTESEIVGSILGLSATGGQFVNESLILAGFVVMIIGFYLLYRDSKNSKKFEIRRIDLGV